MTRLWKPALRRQVAGLLLLASFALAACGASSTTARLPTPTATQASAPTAAATAAPAPPATTAQSSSLQTERDAIVNWYLRRMTLDEKLGQMMLIETQYRSYTQDVDSMVRGLHAGALIVYKQNMDVGAPGGPQELRTYIQAIQANATIPLMTSMDEEGGGVDRLGEYGFAPLLPSPQATSASGNPQVAYSAGATVAKQMLSFGINTNLAPVADVRGSPNPAELTTRMYGNDPATVVNFAGAFLRGSQESGVIGTLKHWPGIGSVTVDPHLALPTMDRSRQVLDGTDFASFKQLLPLNPGMVMVTHVIVPGLDPSLPATLSPKIVQGILRDQFGYQGVVMTDSLYMRGISLQYNLGQAGVLAVMAGDDLLEGAFDTASMRFMIESLKAAIADGRISETRINQSVGRILALKLRFGLLPLPDHDSRHATVLAAPISPAHAYLRDAREP